MSNRESQDGGGAEHGARVTQDFCDWCPAEDIDPSYKIDVERFSFNAWFCSLECAARWGCAADQDEIEEVPV